MSTKITVHSEEPKRDPWEGVRFPCVARHRLSGKLDIARNYSIRLTANDWEPVNAIYDTPPHVQKADPWEGVTLPWIGKSKDGTLMLATERGKDPDGEGVLLGKILNNSAIVEVCSYIYEIEYPPLPDPVTITFEQGGEG